MQKASSTRPASPEATAKSGLSTALSSHRPPPQSVNLSPPRLLLTAALRGQQPPSPLPIRSSSLSCRRRPMPQRSPHCLQRHRTGSAIALACPTCLLPVGAASLQPELPRLRSPVLPNPSLEATRYGMRCKPGPRRSAHFRDPGLQRIPPRSPQLER
jgi:hypothetical protein